MINFLKYFSVSVAVTFSLAVFAQSQEQSQPLSSEERVIAAKMGMQCVGDPEATREDCASEFNEHFKENVQKASQLQIYQEPEQQQLANTILRADAQNLVKAIESGGSTKDIIEATKKMLENPSLQQALAGAGITITKAGLQTAIVVQEEAQRTNIDSASCQKPSYQLGVEELRNCLALFQSVAKKHDVVVRTVISDFDKKLEDAERPDDVEDLADRALTDKTLFSGKYYGIAKDSEEWGEKCARNFDDPQYKCREAAVEIFGMKPEELDNIKIDSRRQIDEYSNLSRDIQEKMGRIMSEARGDSALMIAGLEKLRQELPQETPSYIKDMIKGMINSMRQPPRDYSLMTRDQMIAECKKSIMTMFPAPGQPVPSIQDCERMADEQLANRNKPKQCPVYGSGSGYGYMPVCPEGRSPYDSNGCPVCQPKRDEQYDRGPGLKKEVRTEQECKQKYPGAIWGKVMFGDAMDVVCYIPAICTMAIPNCPAGTTYNASDVLPWDCPNEKNACRSNKEFKNCPLMPTRACADDEEPDQYSDIPGCGRYVQSCKKIQVNKYPGTFPGVSREKCKAMGANWIEEAIEGINCYNYPTMCPAVMPRYCSLGEVPNKSLPWSCNVGCIVSDYPKPIFPKGQKEQIWNSYGLRSWVREDVDPAKIKELEVACKYAPSWASDIWPSSAGNYDSSSFGLPNKEKCLTYTTPPTPGYPGAETYGPEMRGGIYFKEPFISCMSIDEKGKTVLKEIQDSLNRRVMPSWGSLPDRIGECERKAGYEGSYTMPTARSIYVPGTGPLTEVHVSCLRSKAVPETAINNVRRAVDNGGSATGFSDSEIRLIEGYMPIIGACRECSGKDRSACYNSGVCSWNAVSYSCGVASSVRTIGDVSVIPNFTCPDGWEPKKFGTAYPTNGCIKVGSKPAYIGAETIDCRWGHKFNADGWPTGECNRSGEIVSTGAWSEFPWSSTIKSMISPSVSTARKDAGKLVVETCARTLNKAIYMYNLRFDNDGVPVDCISSTTAGVTDGSFTSTSGTGTASGMYSCFYPNAKINGTPSGFTVWCEKDYYNCHQGSVSGAAVSLNNLTLGAPSTCESGWSGAGSEYCNTGPSGPATEVAKCVANCVSSNPAAWNSSSCMGFRGVQTGGGMMNMSNWRNVTWSTSPMITSMVDSSVVAGGAEEIAAKAIISGCVSQYGAATTMGNFSWNMKGLPTSCMASSGMSGGGGSYGDVCSDPSVNSLPNMSGTHSHGNNSEGNICVSGDEWYVTIVSASKSVVRPPVRCQNSGCSEFMSTGSSTYNSGTGCGQYAISTTCTAAPGCAWAATYCYSTGGSGSSPTSCDRITDSSKCATYNCGAWNGTSCNWGGGGSNYASATTQSACTGMGGSWIATYCMAPTGSYYGGGAACNANFTCDNGETVASCPAECGSTGGSGSSSSMSCDWSSQYWNSSTYACRSRSECNDTSSAYYNSSECMGVRGSSYSGGGSGAYSPGGTYTSGSSYSGSGYSTDPTTGCSQAGGTWNASGNYCSMPAGTSGYVPSPSSCTGGQTWQTPIGGGSGYCACPSGQSWSNGACATTTAYTPNQSLFAQLLSQISDIITGVSKKPQIIKRIPLDPNKYLSVGGNNQQPDFFAASKFSAQPERASSVSGASSQLRGILNEARKRNLRIRR